ncbi:MAG: trehalose-phosphatase [Alphaproteobacteria bacterium]|nr:trehalose-phosphatase [Alphaproteobacteria bacterium]
MQLNVHNDALFLDIDGTLLDIAETPQSVIVPPSLLQTLERLSKKMNGALALITGRSLANVDDLFRPLKLPAAGSHGAELRLSANSNIETADPLPDALSTGIKAAFADIPGVIIEDKTYSLAVHYRKAPKAKPFLSKQLNELLAPFCDKLSLVEGKMVFEIALLGRDKVFALRRFLQNAPFSGRTLVFIGDDAVDADAIDFCRQNGGVGVWVGSEYDGDRFESPQSVRDWLKQQADR